MSNWHGSLLVCALGLASFPGSALTAIIVRAEEGEPGNEATLGVIYMIIHIYNTKSPTHIHV